MGSRCIALALAMLSLSACNRESTLTTPSSPTAPPTTSAPSMVRGVVLDFQTAQPIAGAIVRFASESDPDAASAVSDINGRYSLPQPPSLGGGPFNYYRFFVNDQNVGRGYPRSTNYRGDLAVDKGKCVSRYGVVLDSRTYRPIAGATATSLSNKVLATTGADGWYQIDWGCGVGYVGFNTVWHIMSHPDYVSTNFAGGRGIIGLLREDVLLTPR